MSAHADRALDDLQHDRDALRWGHERARTAEDAIADVLAFAEQRMRAYADSPDCFGLTGYGLDDTRFRSTDVCLDHMRDELRDVLTDHLHDDVARRVP